MNSNDAQHVTLMMDKENDDSKPQRSTSKASNNNSKIDCSSTGNETSLIGKKSFFRIAIGWSEMNRLSKVLGEHQIQENLLTPSEASHLRAIYQKVDNNQDGEIDALDIDHAVETGKFSFSLIDKSMELKGQTTLRKIPQIVYKTTISQYIF